MPFEKGTFIVPRPEDPKYIESRNKGFRVRWPVAGGYEIVRGILVPKASAGWRDSYPVNHRSIPVQLAKIQEGDEGALLAFARKYGMPGLGNLLPTFPLSLRAKKLLTEKDILSNPIPGVPLAQLRTYAKTFVRADRKAFEKYCDELELPDQEVREAWLSSGGGDPLPWIWAHVRTLKTCCDLTGFIEDGDDELAGSYLRKFQAEQSRDSKQLAPKLNVAFLHQAGNFIWNQPEGWTVLDFAKFLRRTLINKNIEQIRIAMEPEGDTEKSFFEYRSLIEIAYWHLHNLIVDGTMKRCERQGCGGFFVRKHDRTRFCPEPTTGPKKESRCAVLARVLKAKQGATKKQRGQRGNRGLRMRKRS